MPSHAKPMVPSPKMLFWVAVLVVPLAGVGGMLPGAGALPFAIVALFALVAIADALASRAACADLRVCAPAIVRLWKGRESGIDLTLVVPKAGTKLSMRVALQLPPELGSPQEDMLVVFPENQPVAKFRWPCVAARRGNFKLTRCFLERSSRIGLWNIRSAVPLQVDVAVWQKSLRLARKCRAAGLTLAGSARMSGLPSHWNQVSSHRCLE